MHHSSEMSSKPTNTRPWYALDDSKFVPGKNGRFTGPRGDELATRSWLPLPAEGSTASPVPRGVVLFCHGYGHRLTDDEEFDMEADRYCRAGYACHGIDNIGHGDSPGIPCYIPDYTFLIEDNLAYAVHLVSHYERVLKAAVDAQAAAASAPTEGEESKAVEPTAVLSKRIPLFLLGESMGGAVALMVAHDGRVKVDGVVLIAPMCGIDPKLVPPQSVLSILTCFSKCCPSAPLIPTGQNLLELCFKDKAKFERADKDPRRYAGKLRLLTGLSMKNLSEEVQRLTPSFTFPMIVFHGLADAVTSPAMSRNLFEKSSSFDKTFVGYEGGYHALWWEPAETVEELFLDVLEWLNEHSTPNRAPELVCEDILRKPGKPVVRKKRGPKPEAAPVDPGVVEVRL